MIQFKILHDSNNDFVEPDHIDFEIVAHMDEDPFFKELFHNLSLTEVDCMGGLSIFELWCIENKKTPDEILIQPHRKGKLTAGEVNNIQSWFDRWSESRFKYTVRPSECWWLNT